MLYLHVKTARIAFSLEPRERFRGEGFLCCPPYAFSARPAKGSVNNGNFPTLSPATIGPIRIQTLCSRKITHYFGKRKNLKQLGDSQTFADLFTYCPVRQCVEKPFFSYNARIHRRVHRRRGVPDFYSFPTRTLACQRSFRFLYRCLKLAYVSNGDTSRMNTSGCVVN